MTRPFQFTDRTCTACGGPFAGLETWDLCGDCSASAHRARLDAIRRGRAYTIDSIGGACPIQAEGRTPDGRPYYFRARNGVWTLQVADDPTGDAVYGVEVASGVDDTEGWMADDAVLAILDKHLAHLDTEACQPATEDGCPTCGCPTSCPEAEVERLREDVATAVRAETVALARLQEVARERDALRAQVARVEALADDWKFVDDANAAYAARVGGRSRFSEGIAARADMLRAALARPTDAEAGDR